MTKRNPPIWPIIYILLLLGLMTACTTSPDELRASATARNTPDATATLTATASATSAPTPTLTPTITATVTPQPDVAPTLAPIAVQFVTNGSRATASVALTFDLCQDPAYPAGFDVNIVHTLQQYNAPATFFAGGDWMRTHPDEILLLAADARFELGNHSWSHPDFRKLDRTAMDDEIVKTQDLLYKLTGREARLFRLPYGFSSDEALSTAAAHGLLTIQWDTVTGDPDPNFDAATILRAVRESAQNGSIIIMHANGRGWHTAEALPGVIEYLRGHGLNLVTVSQLLGLDTGN